MWRKYNETQIGLKAAGSADIKSHEISLVLNRGKRRVLLGNGSMGMWSLMRSLSNLPYLKEICLILSQYLMQMEYIEHSKL